MTSIIKVILAIILLGCLLKMPYGYYQFVRLAASIGFIWLAYQYRQTLLLLLTSIACAILFNPIYKVSFPRKTWNKLDTIIAAGLIIWVIIELIYLAIKKKKAVKVHL